MLNSEKKTDNSKLVTKVIALLDNKFDNWRRSTPKSKEVVDAMQNTHEMVVSYLVGMLK